MTTTTDAIQQAINHARANHDTYLDGFKELLRIPSISTDPAYKAEVQAAADWLVREMERIGLRNCAAMPSAGHPVVYGEWLEAGEARPTVLVYAHYDVQPVDPLNLWETPPFEPTVRGNRLYARGVIDDKCGAWINLKALESIFQTAGTLPVNVKIFFEGEEESGSPSMEPFVREHRAKLAADLLLISDGGSHAGQPMSITAVRGIVDGEVVVTGPDHDLHSGGYGGIVHNPAHMVGKIIAAFHDDEGSIQIPGFYDDVQPLSASAQEQLEAQEEWMVPLLKERSGAPAFWGVPTYSLLERATAQPTLDVNGIYGGYQGEGGKTIIPSQAGFKVSMRLVADQDPYDIGRKFTTFVESFRTETLDIQVRTTAFSWAAQLLTEGPAVDALNQAFEATWGTAPRPYRNGGSIPIIGMFQRELAAPVINLGYGVGENGHAPNEYYELEWFGPNIETAIHFLYTFADLSQPNES